MNFPNLVHLDLRGNDCVNASFSNVSEIDFNVDPVLNECFFNWFNPTTPSGVEKISIFKFEIFIILILGFIIMK